MDYICSISQAVDHNSKGTGNKTASKWETHHFCNPSHPYIWICGRLYQMYSGCLLLLLSSNDFQPSLWPTGWYPATMSCRSTPRRTSLMAPSASWSCPSSVDWGSTLTGWHTGWLILIFEVEKCKDFCQIEYIVRWSYSLKTLLKVTPTALWSEASVSRWSTLSHSQILFTDPCR